MIAAVALAAWVLTVAAGFLGHGLEAGLGAVVAVLATVAAVLEPKRRLARHDHVVQDGWGQLDRELRRQRRHGRPLSIALVRLDAAPPTGLDDVAHRLGAELRGDDFVFVADGLLHVVMPEVDTTSAAIPVDRLSGVLHDLGLSGTAAVAAYPGDGLTVPALFERLGTMTPRPMGVGAAASPASADEASVPRPRAEAESVESLDDAEPVDVRTLAPSQPDPGTLP